VGVEGGRDGLALIPRGEEKEKKKISYFEGGKRKGENESSTLPGLTLLGT